ncbi:hypothetical protein BG004_001326, partial [Podila humilis]
MGIQGLWGLIRSRAYIPQEHCSSRLPCHRNLHLDVAGTFFTTIRWAYSTHNQELDRAHAIIENAISRIGEKDNVVIYIDGQPSKEKQSTFDRRQALRQQSLSRAEQ